MVPAALPFLLKTELRNDELVCTHARCRQNTGKLNTSRGGVPRVPRTKNEGLITPAAAVVRSNNIFAALMWISRRRGSESVDGRHYDTSTKQQQRRKLLYAHTFPKGAASRISATFS